MKRNLIFIALLFFVGFYLNAKQNATIQIDLSNSKIGALEKPLVGMFMEYIYFRINGKFGISAEELEDRGFDCEKYGMDWEHYQYWSLHYTCSSDSILNGKPWYSGSNLRGLRHYLIQRTAEVGESGFKQKIILDPNKTFDFYIHQRGTADSLYLRLTKTRTNEVIFEKCLGYVSEYWEKRTAVIPPISTQENVEILIFTKNKGDIHLDEASLMSRDNKYNLRKEFFELMKILRPKILRFPGGCFADYSTWHFEEHIGPKDQRSSPNYWFDASIQRMDFSIDEYMAFCNELNIEPYLLFNVGNGTVQEALNLLEYVNGAPTTPYGKKRAENGHPEPYNVTYFEVGNEQWENYDPNYPSKYLDFYKALKQYDPKIKLMVNGNHWLGVYDINRIFSVVADNSEYYSWHPAAISYPEKNLSEEEEYWGMVSWSKVTQTDIDWITDNLQKHTGNKTLHAPTEYWIAYDRSFSDTSIKARSLEAALSEMNFLHTFLKNYETTGPACRTIFVGIIVSDSTSQDGRLLYGTPGFHAYSMCYNNLGYDYVPSTYIGNSFTLKEFKFMNFLQDIPFLDVLTTKTKDTLYIAVINRHISDIVSTNLQIPNWKKEKKAKIIELASSHYLDYNSSTNPEKVSPKVFEQIIKDRYNFPPHSYTIISIPMSDFLTGIDSGVDEKIPEFNLLPNPADDFIYFDAFGKLVDFIEIYDLQGKLMIKLEQNKTGFLEIDIRQLETGMYILKSKIEGKEIQGKFLKK